jgi:predicted CXXCH cytochrome family protein
MPEFPHSDSSHINQQYVPNKTFLHSDSLQPLWHSPYWLVFCDNCHDDHQGSFRALVSTNESNVGIDKHFISVQIRFKWPHDLLTYFQEQGRGFRSQGVQSTCIHYSDLSSYVYLRSKLFAVGNNDDNISPFGNGVDGFPHNNQ